MIFVPVLGMPRSGTSATAAVLRKLNVWMGREELMHPADHHNPNGYHEYLPALCANNVILARIVAGWHSPPSPDLHVGHLLSAAATTWAGSVIRVILEHLITDARANGRSAFAIKDPRMVFTLPVWLAALPKNIPVYPVVVRREFDAVVRSWEKADYIPSRYIHETINRYQEWLDHRTLESFAKPQIEWIRYEDLLNDPTSIIHKLIQNIYGYSREGVERVDIGDALMAIDRNLNHSGVAS